MFDYIKGVLFSIVFIYFLGSLGKKLTKGEMFSKNLIYGFILYTFIQFIGGFIVQLFRLPWIVYQGYMIVSLLILLGFMFYKNKPTFHTTTIIGHFKQYGVIYLIAIVFVILACMNLQYQWNANNIDDGYYLMKMRMSPYVTNFVDYNFASGFNIAGSFVRSINTFEIEGAFFSQILGIETSIYAKVFLSFINYVIVLNTIHWFYHVVAGKYKKQKTFIFAMIPILFFCLTQEILKNYNLLNMQDSWQFNTAMWYGSTLVRTAGIFMLLTPLLEKEKLGMRAIIFYALTSIALLSKATQALPIAALIGVIYIHTYAMQRIKNKKILLYGMILLFIILIMIPVQGFAAVNASVVYDQAANNFSSPLIKVSIFLIAISYMLGSKRLRKWNTLLIVIGIFMLVPRLNTVFMYLCIYDFVAARLLTLYLFTLMVTAVLVFYMIVNSFLKANKEVVLLYMMIGCVMISIPIISFQRNIGLKHTMDVLINNPTLQPETTLALGSRLAQFEEEIKTTLNVLMPLWVVNDGTPHAVAAMLRYNAFNIFSIGTIPRYKDINESSPFANYTKEEQDVWEAYHNGETDKKDTLKQILDSYPINCVIVYYDDAVLRMKEDFGFRLIDKVKLSDNMHHYYILYKD